MLSHVSGVLSHVSGVLSHVSGVLSHVSGVLSHVSGVFRYAMKCLDKKRIKMKGGETLALNERIMLSLVSTGVSNAQYF